ncbi:MAG: hypothetical protein SGPRY_002813 [Prymnesium sp.]
MVTLPAHQPADASASSPRKWNCDGQPKVSSMKAGQHKVSYTIYFKYQVALDYIALCEKKAAVVISNLFGDVQRPVAEQHL